MLPEIDILHTSIADQLNLFDTYPPDPQLCVSVIIPARNEVNHLEHALEALRNQCRVDGAPIPGREFEVLLLLNNCTDASVDVAKRYQQRYPLFPLRIATIRLPPEKANVGTARRLLMDEACRRLFRVGRPQGIIASTDADTRVDRHWIDQIRAEIASGCEVVGGRILTYPDGNPVRVNHLRDVTYRMLIAQIEAHLDPLVFDPWPRHFQHFGASLALTCNAYNRVGGLPPVPYLEDEALYKALLRTDTRIRKSPLVRATTSTRTLGQVEVGFSEQLRYWTALNQAQKSQLVEAAGAIIQRLQNRHKLRIIWQNRRVNPAPGDLQTIANQLMIDVTWLRQRLVQTSYFGQLWQEVEIQMGRSAWSAYWPPVPIPIAIRELRLFLQTTKSYRFQKPDITALSSEINLIDRFHSADLPDG